MGPILSWSIKVVTKRLTTQRAQSFLPFAFAIFDAANGGDDDDDDVE